MVNIVHVTYIFSELEKVTDHSIKIFRFESSLVQRRIKVKFDVEFEATHPRKIIFSRVEKHALKKIGRRFEGGRIPRPQLAIDLNQCLLSGFDTVFLHGLADNHSHIVTFRIEDGKFSDPGIEHGSHSGGFYFLIRFDQDFACLFIHNVSDRKTAFQIIGRYFHLRYMGLGDEVV